MVPRKWTTIFVAVGCVVFALKTWLAYSTAGAADMSLWESFVSHIHECGVCVYKTGGLIPFPGGSRVNPFNHPPFVIHYLRILDFLSNTVGLNFRFAFRLVTSLIDVGSALLVYRLLIREGLFTPWRFLFYLMAPATIIISGYHGNTDTVIVFFVLLTAVSINKPFWAGLSYGMAINVKVVPIIFLVVFLAHLEDWPARVRFVLAAGLTAVIGSLPYIFQDPVTVVREVLGYASLPGRWGWTRILFDFMQSADKFEVVARVGGYVLLLIIFGLSVKVNRTHRPPLMIQLGMVVFLFIAFTSGWGTNYMAWPDAFPVAIGVIPALIYYVTSGALLSYLYFIVENERTPLMNICWLAVLVVTWFYARVIGTYDKRSSCAQVQQDLADKGRVSE